MATQNILNRINSYAEYQKKMDDYESHIVNMMIGKKGQPIPLHVMVVSGDKGVGKTYRAEEILSKQNIRNYEIVNSSMSAVQLYKFMWEHNDAIIVLDDVNSIIQDSKDGASLLKACTETKHIRKLNWQKQNANCVSINKFNLGNNRAIESKIIELCNDNPKLQKAYDAGKLFPDTFYFTGSLIILTNKPLSVIDRATEGAVSNRGWHQEMLFSVDGAVDLIKNSASKMKTFNDIQLTKMNVQKAIKFLSSPNAIRYYKTEGKLPTLRTLGKIALEYQLNDDVNEDTLANNTECPAY